MDLPNNIHFVLDESSRKDFQTIQEYLGPKLESELGSRLTLSVVVRYALRQCAEEIGGREKAE